MSTNDSTDSAKCVDSSRGRKRKSRWSDVAQAKTSIPGMPTVLPNTFTPLQQEIYVLQLQIEEISRQLRSSEVTIPKERSPSPEPIYDLHGKRLNTREYRVREKLKEQRHHLIQQLQLKNPCFKPPADYKPPMDSCREKVFIPQEEYSNVNFIGLLIGPRGNTLKTIEKDTGAKIIIRGKGSTASSKVKSIKVAEDEPLHAFVTACTSEAVTKAVSCIQEIIKLGINEPDFSNQLRRKQLFELAQINGTVRQPCMRKSWSNTVSSIVCLACGGGGHITSDCRSSKPLNNQGTLQSAGDNAVLKYDETYMDFLAEIGGLPSCEKNPPRSFQVHHKPTSVEGVDSRADILQAPVPLIQQATSSQYPSPKVATPLLTDCATASPLLEEYTDPLLTFYTGSTDSSIIDGRTSTTEFSVPGSSQYVHQPPAAATTSAPMDLPHGPYDNWAEASSSVSGYAEENAYFHNLGQWVTENVAMYGYVLPPPRYIPPKPQ